jgi:hypothetical protein
MNIKYEEECAIILQGLKGFIADELFSSPRQRAPA